MTHGDVQAAKAQRVEPGEQIVIARDGEPVVELIPYARRASRARAAFLGSMKGQIDMSRFDEADEEIAREFGCWIEALARQPCSAVVRTRRRRALV